MSMAPGPPAAALRGPSAAAAGWTPLHLALAGIILTYAWRFQDLVPGLRQIQFVTLVTLAAFAAFALGDGPARIGGAARHPVFRLATTILGLMVLSVPLGVYPRHTFNFILQDHVKTFAIFVMLAVGVRSVRQVERMLLVHVVGALFYSVFVLWHFKPDANGRLGGLVYYDANDLGMMLVCTLPFAVYFLRPGGSLLLRAVSLAAVAVFVLLLVKSGSRGAFLGLIAVAGYLLVGFRAFSASARYGAVFGTVGLLLCLGTDRYWEMMSTLLNPTQDYNWSGGSRSGRMEVWKRGVGYMASHPLTGVGASAFYAAEGHLSDLSRLQELGQGMKWSAPHNSFVQVGAELGVPGLVVFLLLLRASFRAARGAGGAAGGGPRAPPPGGDGTAALGQVFTASLVAYCITGFFLTQAYSAFLYTVLALLVAFSQAARAEASTLPQPAQAAPRLPRRGRGGGWDAPAPGSPLGV